MSSQEAISKAVDEANLLYPDVKVRKRPTITNVPTAFRHYSAETGELITVSPTGKRSVEKIGTPSLIGDIRQEQLKALKRRNEVAADMADLQSQMDAGTLSGDLAMKNSQRVSGEAKRDLELVDLFKDPEIKQSYRQAADEAGKFAITLRQYAAGKAKRGGTTPGGNATKPKTAEEYLKTLK
jgi:hypothetical protein